MNSMFSFGFSCTMWRREICYIGILGVHADACMLYIDGGMDGPRDTRIDKQDDG